MTRSSVARRHSAKPASAREVPREFPREFHFAALRLAPDSLGFALDVAAHAVAAVRAGTALPAALAALRAALPPERAALARGAVQDIAYRALRRLGTAEWLVARLVRKAPAPHVATLLACAFALLVDDPERAAYAPHTVVDQAVEAIGARRECAFARGLVNAVLRNFLRERDALLSEAKADPVARWNYPRWWIDAVARAWPERWEAVLAAGNVPGPLTLRVNARRTSVNDYLATLGAAGIDAAQIGTYAVRLASPLPVDRIPGFAQGVVSVQDAGAQLAAQWLGARDGMRVLDACAAPGGKTGHVLELADVELVALESDSARAARIDENLTRLGRRAAVRIGDAGTPEGWHDGKAFDRVLADVPCSASGIVRRHPDIRWLRRASDIAALAAEQQRIVDALWPLVAPGGELLYVTCSIFPEEGEAQAARFERVHEDAVRLDAPGQLLPESAGSVSVPAALASSGMRADGRTGSNIDHDGFYYARFQRR
ncbi:16S rRNA (cytosine(967)-C(5))-methyltransferase RsmB [Trinickia caryophylli]|uniref:16S rRNA (cytosine(967)-C(5))-methyltransferase n=1 Tax=Trinickia caryophylli TaxID=28094 RepID=A0A1X7FA50_TRICW|nr:16S rRNA (cytosine(967)-C(5))-methyltransferase RsmB [Trinickia caryophylli]PMS10987.1 16S rRNA (cytosine(967)-C(5))-methyltransferase RsmB [Trinickia caryophylli]TRX18939.1 16S rRNA (cytosine(967)-C(5))-methyltransferase RsmB [Trinickia caryophylli]WQE10262.1 16S rRNA (cytosine(967)-C(5))-methyltransferase RsmB [Trinickia caryophylli]SMF48555.1 16S rRNA (cytosine967-C5)-methyltransferase [Trinickia caryophylli]GLU34292.1 ribosomal RNA small subunit methyltransferase B [Trinickia caryophyll